MFDPQTLLFISVNKAAVSCYGYTEDEFMHMTLQDIRPVSEQEEFRQTIASIPDGLQNAGIWMHKKKNGDILYADITSGTIRHHNKTRRISLINDITELVVAKNKLLRTNEHLEETLQRYDTLTEAAQEAVWEHDLVNNEVTWNRGIETIFGYRRDTKEADVWFAKIHDDDIKNVKDSLAAVLKQRLKTWSGAYRFQCADGSFKYVENNAVVIFNKKGEPVRIIGSMHDVTLKHRQEAEIKKLSLVAQVVSNAIIIINSEGLIEWVNESFTTMTGYTAKEAKGKRTPQLLHGEKTDEAIAKEIRELITAKVRFSREILHYHKNGSQYWVHVDFSPMMVDGQLQSTICIHSDITEKKEREQQIEEQNRRLKEIAFTNSHVLRSPVTTILGLAGLLAANTNLQKEESETLAYLLEAADKLDLLTRNIAKNAEEVV